MKKVVQNVFRIKKMTIFAALAMDKKNSRILNSSKV
jgi:hypothetical protein